MGVPAMSFWDVLPKENFTPHNQLDHLTDRGGIGRGQNGAALGALQP
jgi:hypothetical protein